MRREVARACLTGSPPPPSGPSRPEPPGAAADDPVRRRRRELPRDGPRRPAGGPQPERPALRHRRAGPARLPPPARAPPGPDQLAAPRADRPRSASFRGWAVSMPSGPSSQIRTCDASRWWRSPTTTTSRPSAPPTTPGSTPTCAKPVTFLSLVKLMKVFTAYWLDTAVLPAGTGRRVSRLPERLVLLAVQADEAAHAPVRAALKAIEGDPTTRSTGSRRRAPRWPRSRSTRTTPSSSTATCASPGHSGLDVARDILAHTPHAPVILLDDQRRPRDRPGGEPCSACPTTSSTPARRRSSAACATRSPTSARCGASRSPRSATRSRSRAPTTACGTGTCAPTGCTSRRAGRR